MPATEQTWRNQKVLHAVFGASAVLMVIATLWLFAKDHNREWKDWQLDNRKKEAWMIQARHDALADQFDEKMASYDAEMIEAQAEAIDESLINQFKDEVTSDAQRLAEDAEATVDFAKLDETVESFTAAVKTITDGKTEPAEGEDVTDTSKAMAANSDAMSADAMSAKVGEAVSARQSVLARMDLSLIHISEPTRPY